jgi:hypothetical protein
MSVDQSKSDLQRELERLQEANALGRTETYRRLLAYLVERTIADSAPREVEIAVDVFGRAADFDSASDPFVRVYVHNLRKKLEAHYREHAANSTVRIEIPPGAYRVDLKRRDVEVQPAPPPHGSRPTWAWWLGGASVVATVFALGWFLGASTNAPFATAAEDEERSPVWEPLLSSPRPTIVAIGDLFVFQERDPVTGATRTVRDASINSASELARRSAMGKAAYTNAVPSPIRYYNEGVAAALYHLRSLPGLSARNIEIKAASQLTAHDLRESDVIFIGLYKTLGPLLSIFDASLYETNAEFTQLTHDETGETYEIKGDPIGRHTDYGLFARLAGPTGNVVVVCAGFTDTSILQIMKTMNGSKPTQDLWKRFFPNGVTPTSFEILFEASGVDRNDISSRILHAGPLDARAAWENIRN